MKYFVGVDVTLSGRIRLLLLSSDTLLAQQIHEGDYKLTEKLLFFLDQFLADHDLGMRDIAGIVAITGPGQFTALRLMCVTLNMLALTYGIPVYGAPIDELSDDTAFCLATRKLSLNTSLVPLYDKAPNITLKPSA